MAWILNIDSALDAASVGLGKDGRPHSIFANDVPKDHAAWMHNAISRLVRGSGLALSELDAVAVTIGPGSYTGLRVGLATAKGICFAIQKPLIACVTLEVMAHAGAGLEVDLLCPMIDARRMEVFTALYGKNLAPIIEPVAMILDPMSFDGHLNKNRIGFFGSGSQKFHSICKNSNASFHQITMDASHMAPLTEKMFKNKHFADLAYSEPLYLKEFQTKPH